MYLLPFYIERTKFTGDPECFVKRIRLNTILDQPNDGLIRNHNPNELSYRVEKKKGIYLKDARKSSTKKNGATTALFISESEGKTVITSIQYNGTARSIVFGALICFVIIKWILGYQNSGLVMLIGIAIVGSLLFGWDNFKPLKAQRSLVQRVIKSCEESEQ